MIITLIVILILVLIAMGLCLAYSIFGVVSLHRRLVVQERALAKIVSERPDAMDFLSEALRTMEGE